MESSYGTFSLYRNIQYLIWKKCEMHVWRGMCPFLLLLNNVGENHSLDIIQRHQTNRQYQYEPRRCHYSIPKRCYKWHNRHQSCTGGVFSGGTWCSSDMSKCFWWVIFLVQRFPGNIYCLMYNCILLVLLYSLAYIIFMYFV